MWLMPENKKNQEPDSVYFLKILLFFILGTMWLRITDIEISGGSISLPLGLLIGIFFASHDHFRIDRKIEYAMLLVAAAISYSLPVGFVLII